MLFNEEFNHIGNLDSKGKMEIEKNKLAKWITPSEDMTQECSMCNNWNICHNRNCPAKAFKTESGKSENCGYEKMTLDYVLMFLDKANSSYIRTYE
jgi:radical SAM protein with 4Fe4S-binding SPASM domain